MIRKRIKMAQSRVWSRTSTFAIGSSSAQSRGIKKVEAVSVSDIPVVQRSRSQDSSRICAEKKVVFLGAPVHARMQNIVQKMLHSEHGVPIRSHKRHLISAIPSAFTGADIVCWLLRNLSIQFKAEAIHLANLFCRHGYFFNVEGNSNQVKDDGSLFRFQTPYYWPSQNPEVSDFEYGVYLVKQVLRSKHRIRLMDYELNSLHKLKLRLAKEWIAITERAEDDIKVFREQKRVAKAILASQEEAFWRLHRPPPGESSVQDSALTILGTERLDYLTIDTMTVEALTEERDLLKRISKRPCCNLSPCIDRLENYINTYEEFDPMMTPPEPSNPWVTGDTTLWEVEKSLVECPSERRVKKWACSLYDLLNDVTGRFKFEDHCTSHHNLENVKFWQACKDLQTIPLHAISGSVKLIYDEFLQRNAPREVNLSAYVMADVQKDIKNPSRFSFTSAKEQIYKLMENDIYPRYLKSEEYNSLLQKAKEAKLAGKGFFAKLQKKKFGGVMQDATEISPCLPHRFARSHLSITRKSSSSMDNIYTACVDGTDHFLGPFVDSKRNSTFSEAFVDSLICPCPDKVVTNEVRTRKISAPGSLNHNITVTLDKVELDGIDEASANLPTFSGRIPIIKQRSISADNVQHDIDADTGLSPKWKMFKTSDIMDGQVHSDLLGCGAKCSPRLSVSHQELSPFRPRLMLASPKQGFYKFDCVSTEQLSYKDGLAASNDSINSTTSH